MLNNRQRAALDHVAANGWITFARYRNSFGVSKSTASSDLTELAQRGWLERHGHGRAAKWVPGRHLRRRLERERWGDE